MNKLSLVATGAVVVLCVLDWQTRFHTDELKNRNQFQLSAEELVTVPLLSSSTNQLLNVFTAAFTEEKAAAETPDNPGMTADQQAAQQGELLTVFAGDNALSLKAVINDEQTYVLIAQKNVKNGQLEVVKYANGASLAGYQLNVLSNTQVTLTNNNQHIVLMMYKSAA